MAEIGGKDLPEEGIDIAQGGNSVGEPKKWEGGNSKVGSKKCGGK